MVELTSCFLVADGGTLECGLSCLENKVIVGGILRGEECRLFVR